MLIHFSRRARRRLGLLAVALLHLAVVATWQRPALPLRADDGEEGVLMLLTPSQMSRRSVAVEQRAPKVRARLPRPVRVTPVPAHAEPTPAPAPQPGDMPAEVPDDPFDAEPAPPADGSATQSLKERSLSLAGTVDKQLRKESRWEKDRVIARESKLAQSIAAAYRERSFSIVENRMINGDTLARIRTPFGTYCVRVNGNRFTGARDPFKDSGTMTLMTCPKG